MADQSIIRISKELCDIQKDSDLSIAVACRDSDVRNVKALIIGPHETPYGFGFFEFAVKFNKDYPRKSPTVTALTTNSGRCRFNPNIYASGKVCLSILGTWRGERGEEWSAAQGLESILISIQSLMSSNPYENEPGFEHARQSSDKKNQVAYVQKIRHESLRITVIQRLEEYLGLAPDGTRVVSVRSAADQNDIEIDMQDLDESSVPFEPFKDLCKQRFLWYYDSYLAAIKQGSAEVTVDQPFTRMPFEGSSNTMEGKFNYPELERRLRNIKKALDAELDLWTAEGAEEDAKEGTIAVNLRNQHRQVVASFKQEDIPHYVELQDNNPFVWNITYFGPSMGNLDGGLFRIKLYLSPRFPEEQPRVRLESKIFHYRIAADGTVCYFPNHHKREDVRSHIDAIFATLEEAEPAYDPRTIVHPEAHAMYWGKPEDRKIYNRRLRKSVQMSMEDFPMD